MQIPAIVCASACTPSINTFKEGSTSCVFSPLRQNNQSKACFLQLPGDSREPAASQMAVLAGMVAQFLLSSLLNDLRPELLCLHKTQWSTVRGTAQMQQAWHCHQSTTSLLVHRSWILYKCRRCSAPQDVAGILVIRCKTTGW